MAFLYGLKVTASLMFSAGVSASEMYLQQARVVMRVCVGTIDVQRHDVDSMQGTSHHEGSLRAEHNY